MTARHLKPSSLVVARARAILAGAVFENSGGAGGCSDGEEPLEELSLLVETAGGEEVARVTQSLRKPVPGTFLGRGKVEEIASLATSLRADVVVFDNDLTPAQARNLERMIGRGVIERSEIILGIFARRARTRAAKLQVELAQLEYMLPRLKRLWTHLERQTGGIGMRAGAGERQIETDRRKIRRRISDLAREIRQIESRRQRMVSSRAEHMMVSLVGYTNAGKSTLMRQLTGLEVAVEDKLFATLDTKTGALVPDRAGGVEPPAGMKILVSDTVGFIRSLPHDLVTSFHATLEEARSADVLLHVVDVSHPRFEEQMDVVERVLEEIGAGDVPVVVVLNKIDRLDGRDGLGHVAGRHGDAACVSALTGEGIARLRERIVMAAARGAEDVTLRFPAADAETMRYVFNHGFNIHRRYGDDGTVEVSARMKPEALARLAGEGSGVELTAGAGGPAASAPVADRGGV